MHLSSQRTKPVEFPDSTEFLPDEHAKLLFSISSNLPPKIQDFARAEGYAISDRTRGFAFNADLVALIKFLDIGTRASNELR